MPKSQHKSELVADKAELLSRLHDELLSTGISVEVPASLHANYSDLFQLLHDYGRILIGDGSDYLLNILQYFVEPDAWADPQPSSIPALSCFAHLVVESLRNPVDGVSLPDAVRTMMIELGYDESAITEERINGKTFLVSSPEFERRAGKRVRVKVDLASAPGAQP